MWDIKTPEALRALASRLAPFVSSRDFVGLYGELGAGKTTFAQGLLAALGVSDGVTSPTYQIVHTFEAGNNTVHHCDFYRVTPSPEEIAHLEEMCKNGIVVAEWPETLGAPLPSDRLEVRIAGEDASRLVALTGFGAWREKLLRFQDISAFLDGNAWGDAACAAIKGDASARTFWRLDRGGSTAMLMDWPLKTDGPPVRNGLAYCQIAHLAVEGRPFVALAEWLRDSAGVGAPLVYAFDAIKGLYLVEDLGDAVFGKLLADGEAIFPLYTLAVDGLIAIRDAKPQQNFTMPKYGGLFFPDYDRQALEIELELLLDWYFKLVRDQVCVERAREAFLEAWSPHLDWLERQPRGLVLRDFHSPNLILRSGHGGNRRLGVIDFQDAVWGHPAYDLVSLLQDARADIPAAVEAELYARYTKAAAALVPSFASEDFAYAYAIVGAQRNTKIAGIFARLSLRDGKDEYLAHLPRIMGYLTRNLNSLHLAGLRGWYDEHVFNEAHRGRGPYTPGLSAVAP